MDVNKKIKLNFYVDSKLYTDFKILCINKNMSLTKYLTALMERELK